MQSANTQTNPNRSNPVLIELCYKMMSVGRSYLFGSFKIGLIPAIQLMDPNQIDDQYILVTCTR